MPASGSCIFTDPESFQASLDQTLTLLVVVASDFHARLTWVEFPTLRLVRADETAPRVACVSLPPKLAFVTFPTQRGSLLVCDGVELEFGDIMFHSPGERLYQRTAAACRWGAISLTTASLMALSRTIIGRDLVPPPIGRILRPLPQDRQHLIRQHAQTGRIAETNLGLIGHPEVARALEQDLIWALATCLTNGKTQDDPAARRRRSRIITQFEAVLMAHHSRFLTTREICTAIGVSEQTLTTCCKTMLGMSPGRYQHLWRLKQARTDLLRGSAAMSITEVASRHGFPDLDRFIAEYRRAYGEMPPRSPRGAGG